MPKRVIYATIACGSCARARKRRLEEKQVPFEKADVSYNAEQRHAMMEKPPAE